MDELRPISQVVEEVLAKEMVMAAHIYIEDQHLVFAFDGYEYDIWLPLMDTPEKLLTWVYHMAGKNWIDLYKIRFFTRLIAAHFKMNLRV